MSRAAEASDGQAEAVAEGGVQGNARIGRGNFLHRAAEVDAAEVEVAHGAFVGEAPAREVGREVGAPEDEGKLDEIVGEHGAADDARVAVVELRGGEADAGAEVGIVDAGREEAGDDGVVVTLEMATDVVAVVAEAVGVLGRGGEEKEACGLDGAAGEDDGFRVGGAALGLGGVGGGGREIFDAGGAAGGVGDHARDVGAGCEGAAAGGEGAGEEGVMGAVARIGGAGEADALATLDAGGASVVGDGVDGERGREVAPTERGGAAGEPGAVAAAACAVSAAPLAKRPSRRYCAA